MFQWIIDHEIILHRLIIFPLRKKNSHAFEILMFLAYLRNNYALHSHSDILIYFAFQIGKTVDFLF